MRSSWTVVLVLFLLISVAVVAVLLQGKNSKDCSMRLADKKCISLERATTQDARARGLSGRVSMPMDEGMLFVFDKPRQECFWMKGMHFDIDIIWLDAQKKVVHIERNVKPASYPNSYCPDKAAQYVIEVNAGVAERASVELGGQLSF